MRWTYRFDRSNSRLIRFSKVSSLPNNGERIVYSPTLTLTELPFFADQPVECEGAVPELVKIAGQIVALQLFFTVIVRVPDTTVTRAREMIEGRSMLKR